MEASVRYRWPACRGEGSLGARAAVALCPQPALPCLSEPGSFGWSKDGVVYSGSAAASCSRRPQHALDNTPCSELSTEDTRAKYTAGTDELHEVEAHSIRLVRALCDLARRRHCVVGAMTSTEVSQLAATVMFSRLCHPPDTFVATSDYGCMIMKKMMLLL